MDLQTYLEEGYSSSHSDIDHMNISEVNLGSIVAKGDVFLQGNAFFILLDDYNHFVNANDNKVAAYISYLLSYLVFVVTTPPRSMEIALSFAEKSIELHDIEQYHDWLEYVKKGN